MIKTTWDVGAGLLCVASSGAVLCAAVVCLHDMNGAPERLKSLAGRAAYNGSLAIFLILLAMGEGLTLFGTLFGQGEPPTTGDAMNQLAMLIFAAWAIVVRPLTRMDARARIAVACPPRLSRAASPVVHGPGSAAYSALAAKPRGE